MQKRRRNIAKIIILTFTLTLLVFATGVSAQGGAEGVVIGTGFNSPQGVLVDDEGTVWVIDSGVGGDESLSFFNTQALEMAEVEFGESARVVRITADGTQEDIATLPSLVIGEEALGGSRLAVLDGSLYATVGQGAGDPEAETLANFGGVVRIEGGEVEQVASTWDFERANNSDGTTLFDSHPYGLTAGSDGYLYVADAGANDLLRVDPETGAVELVAVFDPLPGVFPSDTRGGELLTDPVPTAVVIDQDGNYFVSLLSGVPFVPGSAKVVKVTADGQVSDFATGLTMLTDLRMGPDGNLYAVQFGQFTEQGPTPESGAIIRVREGTASKVMASGLSFPTSLDFNSAGDAYVIANGVGAPGSGEVIMLPALTSQAGRPMIGPGSAPVPASAYGVPIDPEKGYFVEEIADGLYWITEGAYTLMFLTTGEGVIIVDAPPSIGENILNAVAEVTDEPITHVIYSHSHADHIGAAQLYPEDATYIAHAEIAAQLATSLANSERPIPYGVASGGSAVPLPTVTFDDNYTLEVGNQVLELEYRGPNHEPGNIYIYAPEQKTLMLVDIIYPGWSPFKDLALAEEVISGPMTTSCPSTLIPLLPDTWVDPEHVKMLKSKKNISRIFRTTRLRPCRLLTLWPLPRRLGSPTRGCCLTPTLMLWLKNALI
jgi:glyoxylase-like metal-dependent hydrolase (beta-lactamase superfamily II)